MNAIKVIAAVVILGASCGATVFVAATAMSTNDNKLFMADDKNRATMLARNCGKSGRLLQDPLTNAYLCMYVNPDGSTLTVETSQHPYLDQLAHR